MNKENPSLLFGTPGFLFDADDAPGGRVIKVEDGLVISDVLNDHEVELGETVTLRSPRGDLFVTPVGTNPEGKIFTYTVQMPEIDELV